MPVDGGLGSFYGNSAVSEEVSNHYVNLPHVLYVDDDLDLVADDQHKVIGW